jgi:hypothetical protein
LSLPESTNTVTIANEEETANSERALLIDAQARWTKLGHKPEINSQAACDKVVKWHRKEEWATEAD